MTEMSAPQPDRDTLVVTPKLDEGEYKSDYPDDPQTESVTSKCDQVTMTNHFYFLNFQIQSLFLIRWYQVAFYFLLFAYINILQSLLIIFELEQNWKLPQEQRTYGTIILNSNYKFQIPEY